MYRPVIWLNASPTGFKLETQAKEKLPVLFVILQRYSSSEVAKRTAATVELPEMLATVPAIALWTLAG